MSFETKNSSNLNLDDAQQISPQLLEEIVNDDELKTLTEEEIKAVFGGRRMMLIYGGVSKPIASPFARQNPIIFPWLW
jgi:hypothetical protein